MKLEKREIKKSEVLKNKNLSYIMMFISDYNVNNIYLCYIYCAEHASSLTIVTEFVHIND